MQERSRSSRESRAGVRPRVLGRECPRIWTPPLRELTEETSLGFAAIEFAVGVCGVELYPWQRWLLIHALELDVSLTVDTIDQRGALDPIFRFRKIVVLVARQNGKSTLSQVLSLFFLFILGTDLVLGTAQDLDTAEEVWDGALDIIEETPELAALADRPVRVNGKKTIRLLSGERYKVKAANRRAGRGLSGDLILLDELREHQSWDAWGAITKTTQARPAAMIWALSNAGDVTSIVLRYLRKMAHAAMGDPDGINAKDDPGGLLPTEQELSEIADLSDDDDDSGDLEPEDFEEDVDTLGLFEWSAPPGCSVFDRDGWAQANPSMGYGIAERTIAGDAKGDPEWVFRTEVLCQWSEGTLDSVFPPGAWDAGTDARSRIADGSLLCVCVDVSATRGMTYVTVAGHAPDGRVHVEVVAARAGTDWVVDWLVAPDRPVWSAVTWQANGAPVSSLVDKLSTAERDGEPLPVRAWGGPDLGRAHGEFYDLVVKHQLVHLPSPVLDVAAQTAVTKPLGDGVWVFDRRRSPRDCAPLIAAVGAVWLLLPRRSEAKRPQVHVWPDDLLERAAAGGVSP